MGSAAARCIRFDITELVSCRKVRSRAEGEARYRGSRRCGASETPHHPFRKIDHTAGLSARLIVGDAVEPLDPQVDARPLTQAPRSVWQNRPHRAPSTRTKRYAVGDSCSKPQCRHTSARRFLSIVEIARMVSGEKSFDKIRIDSRLRADHVQQSSDLASRGRPDGSCDGVRVLKGLK